MKTKKHIILFICFLIVSNLFSQNLNLIWKKQIGNISFDGFGEDFFQIDSSNNIIITGFLTNTQIDTFQINGPFVAKYSPIGDLLWLSLPDTSFNFYPKFLKIASDNSIFILSYPMVSNMYSSKIKLVKLNNQSGHIEWEKEFVIALPDLGTDPAQFKAFEIDKNNNLHFAVNLYSYIVLPNNDSIVQDSFNKKYYIFKFDSNGTFINFFRSFETTTIYDLKIDDNENNYHFTAAPLPFNRRIIKYNKDYNQMLHVKDFNLYYNRFHLCNNKNIYTSIIGNDTLFDTNQTENITNNNLFFNKYDSYFELEWIKKLKGFNECPNPNIPSLFMCNTEFSCVKTKTFENDVYVYGLFKYKFSINNEFYYTNDSSKYSYFITKFEKNGNYYWTEVFQSLENIPSDCVFSMMDLQILENGELLCGLMFKTKVLVGDSLYTSHGNDDILLMRLQETGAGLKPLQENKFFSFEVNPNPASGFTNISVDSDNDIDFLLQLYDISGRCVISETHSNSKKNISLNISHLRSGLYFIKLQTDKSVAVRKLIIKY